MAKYYYGTNGNDSVTGALDDQDLFGNFGIGSDTVTGGKYNDVFVLSVDRMTDYVYGGGGEDTVDYSHSDRGLTIRLSTDPLTHHSTGTVTALFNGQSVVVAKLDSIEDVIGSSFADTITGDSGDNKIEGGAGADRINGGDGSDTAVYTHSSAAVSINLNYSVQHGGDAEGDTLVSIENIIGSNQADHLVGNLGANIIEGGGGADYIDGGGTTSSYYWGDTASYLSSPAGVQINLTQVIQHGGDAEGDQLYHINSVFGSAFGDQITGNSGSNLLNGEDGDDYFYHTGGGDTIFGGNGSDTYVVGQISGTSGAYVNLYEGTTVYLPDGPDILYGIENVEGSQNDDTLALTNSGGKAWGGVGSDTLYGGTGSDYLFGGTGNDHLFGGAGDDFLYGQDDNDVLFGGDGADVLDGGSGNNWALYAGSSSTQTGVNINLDAGSSTGFGGISVPYGTGTGADAEGDRVYNIQNVRGSGYDDTLIGDSNDNILIGGDGNDRLIGGDGRDTLVVIAGFQNPGNDVLTGGHINDRDADTFYFDVFNDDPSYGPVQMGNNIITDFQPGVDTLDLANLSTGQGVHVTQHNSDAVVTIDGVDGSITLLGTNVHDVHWISQFMGYPF